jgi:F-type H+-transporting ATPase subunit epsilon
MELKLTIIGKDKITYDGGASAVLVPTQTGIVEILPKHTQLISALAPGEIIVKTKEGEMNQAFKISGGVLEVRAKSNVIILADIVKEE